MQRLRRGATSYWKVEKDGKDAPWRDSRFSLAMSKTNKFGKETEEEVHHNSSRTYEKFLGITFHCNALFISLPKCAAIKSTRKVHSHLPIYHFIGLYLQNTIHAAQSTSHVDFFCFFLLLSSHRFIRWAVYSPFRFMITILHVLARSRTISVHYKMTTVKGNKWASIEEHLVLSLGKRNRPRNYSVCATKCKLYWNCINEGSCNKRWDGYRKM